jgi:hypothetical protein
LTVFLTAEFSFLFMWYRIVKTYETELQLYYTDLHSILTHIFEE